MNFCNIISLLNDIKEELNTKFPIIISLIFMCEAMLQWHWDLFVIIEHLMQSTSG